MSNVCKFEEKYGWVEFCGKVYILKELMKPTGVVYSDTIETSAKAIDNDYNSYKIYWKINKFEIENPDYNLIDRVEKDIDIEHEIAVKVNRMDETMFCTKHNMQCWNIPYELLNFTFDNCDLDCKDCNYLK